MSRKQIYTLIGMGLLMLVILGGVVLAIDFNNQLQTNREDTSAMIDSLQATTDAKNAATGNH